MLLDVCACLLPPVTTCLMRHPRPRTLSPLMPHVTLVSSSHSPRYARTDISHTHSHSLTLKLNKSARKHKHRAHTHTRTRQGPDTDNKEQAVGCFTPPRGVLNEGVDCWSGCNAKQGPCDWCGAGMCCRYGWDDKSNGCDGKIGVPGQGHVCSAPPPPPVIDSGPMAGVTLKPLNRFQTRTTPHTHTMIDNGLFLSLLLCLSLALVYVFIDPILSSSPQSL